MENCLNKYFADEFTSDEKTEFLIEVENNERLKEEFIENQNLLALVDWISPYIEREDFNFCDIDTRMCFPINY